MTAETTSDAKLIVGRVQSQARLNDGDCLAASLATITGLDVPNLIDNGPTWFGDFQTWLRDRGWAFTDDDGSRPMVGFSVAVGPSPTLDCNHAAVALDGIVIWDPSPNRDDPGRTFTPRQFWPVFRLASGRPIYDPFAAAAPDPVLFDKLEAAAYQAWEVLEGQGLVKGPLDPTLAMNIRDALYMGPFGHGSTQDVPHLEGAT